jgi:ribonuclease-3
VAELNELEARLGHVFRDTELLRLALTHPSVAYEQGARVQHNQRLEFLGDAVLQLVLTRDLYHLFPNEDEGRLTKARANIANRDFLAERAAELGLGHFLILSRGEERNGGRERPSTLADAFEAVIGALFLDGGLTAAEQFIERHFGKSLGAESGADAISNPKGELQELLQARSSLAPQYQVISSSGPDHDRVFECAVVHEGKELARGQGKTKQAAESEAAMAALLQLRGAEVK